VSVFHTSCAIFQLPSGCRRRMWIPLILSVMAAPPAFGVRLSSPTNRSLAQSPETMTFRSVYFPLTVYWFAMSVAHLRMAAFPDSMGPLGGSTTASSVSKAMLASTVPARRRPFLGRSARRSRPRRQPCPRRASVERIQQRLPGRARPQPGWNLRSCEPPECADGSALGTRNGTPSAAIARRWAVAITSEAER